MEWHLQPFICTSYGIGEPGYTLQDQVLSSSGFDHAHVLQFISLVSCDTWQNTELLQYRHGFISGSIEYYSGMALSNTIDLACFRMIFIRSSSYLMISAYILESSLQSATKSVVSTYSFISVDSPYISHCAWS